jgi:hypothetical protein
MNIVEADMETRHRVLRSVYRCLAEANYTKTPSHVSSAMHRQIRELLNLDPFRSVKISYNILALEMYPELKRTISRSREPLLTAARLAIAGNIIDFGIYSTIDIEGTVERALRDTIAIDDFKLFSKELNAHDRVLYLLDNAGEIVFDMLLIKELQALGKKVTAVVKGGPVLNDCTMEDAIQVGLDKVCPVIDTGSDHVGTILEHTTRAFSERFAQKDQIIISKGQGNFETLMAVKGNIYFLLQAKCHVVARMLELPEGAMILARGDK